MSTQVKKQHRMLKISILRYNPQDPDSVPHMQTYELQESDSMTLFIALNDLIDQYCPNLKAEMAKRPGAEERITAPDGNIYSLPFLGRSGNGWINSFINQPWLDKLGLEMPTTLDEFYEVLKAFKTQDPNGNGIADEIPYAGVLLKKNEDLDVLHRAKG